MNIFHLMIISIILYTSLVFSPKVYLDNKAILAGFVFCILVISNWLIEYLFYSFQGCRLEVEDAWKDSYIVGITGILCVFLVSDYLESDDTTIKYLLITGLTLALWFLYQIITYMLGVKDKCQIQKLEKS